MCCTTSSMLTGVGCGCFEVVVDSGRSATTTSLDVGYVEWDAVSVS